MGTFSRTRLLHFFYYILTYTRERVRVEVEWSPPRPSPQPHNEAPISPLVSNQPHGPPVASDSRLLVGQCLGGDQRLDGCDHVPA